MICRIFEYGFNFYAILLRARSLFESVWWWFSYFCLNYWLLIFRLFFTRSNWLVVSFWHRRFLLWTVFQICITKQKLRGFIKFFWFHACLFLLRLHTCFFLRESHMPINYFRLIEMVLFLIKLIQFKFKVREFFISFSILRHLWL